MTATNHAIAEALYVAEAKDSTYAELFTKQELIELWEQHCVYKTDEHNKIISPDASYDDEVYNALDRYGYWDNK